MIADVQDETGTSSLADLIEQTVNDSAPQISDISQLPLDRATFRILSPDRWRAAAIDYVHRAHDREFCAKPATADEQQQVKASLRLWEARVRWRWPILPAMTITNPDGQPETLICPQTIRHTGLRKCPWSLRRIITHETVHHAQFFASAGVVAPPPLYARADNQANGKDVYRLTEGHADFLEVCITQRQAGRAWDWIPHEIRVTSRYTVIHELLRAARNAAVPVWHQARTGQPVPRPPKLPPGAFSRSQPAIGLSNTGLRFVAASWAQTGPAVWNKVWTDLRLVPTEAEVDDPAQWLKRVGVDL